MSDTFGGDDDDRQLQMYKGDEKKAWMMPAFTSPRCFGKWSRTVFCEAASPAELWLIRAGWSPFPGNINQLVLKLSSYVEQLQKTGGVISEFVNPKCVP